MGGIKLIKPWKVFSTTALVAVLSLCMVLPVFAANGDITDTTSGTVYQASSYDSNTATYNALVNSIIGEKTLDQFTYEYNSNKLGFDTYSALVTKLINQGETPPQAKADAAATMQTTSTLQIVGTPKANLILGNLSVTVNDATLVSKVMVNGVQVNCTPLGNVYTVPITYTTDYVVFVDTSGNNVFASGFAQAPILTASGMSYSNLLGFLSVVVNNSSLVKTVTLDGVSYTIGAAAGADGIQASVVDSTHIKVTGLSADPVIVSLLSTSGTTVTVSETISTVPPISITTTPGTAPVLPATVTAYISNGTTTVAVNWANISSSQYSSAGTFSVIGTIYGTNIQAIANVTVTAPILTATSIVYNGLLEFESVTVNDSSLVKSVTIGTDICPIGGVASSVNGYTATVTDSTHIKITGLSSAPGIVSLLSTSGTTVTI
jgi:hypothetical protein